MTTPWLERTELLLGKETLKNLQHSHVLVVGLGGVGAYAAEMIARAGVGRLTIADTDVVHPSNINRQLVALHSTVGQSKVELLAERLLDINPALGLTRINRYISDLDTQELLDADNYDFVVDAIDTLSPKAGLIVETLKRDIPLVSSMGAGGRTDPTQIEIADISQSHSCKLAHKLRKRLRKWGVSTGFNVVFSPEPVKPGSVVLCDERNKHSLIGTISYMPAVFGCACASVVVRALSTGPQP